MKAFSCLRLSILLACTSLGVQQGAAFAQSVVHSNHSSPRSGSVVTSDIWESGADSYYYENDPIASDYALPISGGLSTSGLGSGGFEAPCGDSCPPSWYVGAEYLYWNRDGNNGHCFNLSPGFGVTNSGQTSGGRITLGRQYDCVDGWELVFTGGLEWDDSDSRIARTPGGLSNTLVGFPGVDVSAFNNANYQTFDYSSKLTSVEWNRRWWGWGIASSFVGLRYLNLDEDLNFSSINAANHYGEYDIRIDNKLFGGQLGYELIKPLHERFSIGAKAKVGAFLNFADTDSLLFNNGQLQVVNCGDEVDIAFLTDISINANYRITNNLVVRGGYNFWYLGGVGVASDKFETVITPATGYNMDLRDSLVVHGVSAGIEYSW